jgi:uncharacterized membrane protein (UPF0127 family)
VFLQVLNETKGTAVAGKVRVATTLKDRLIGLLATPNIARGDGLWLKPCTSVHSFFMRYPIDVIFLDAENRVLRQTTMVPWRLSRWVPRAASVLELSAGEAGRAYVGIGDRLAFKEMA